MFQELDRVGCIVQATGEETCGQEFAVRFLAPSHERGGLSLEKGRALDNVQDRLPIDVDSRVVDLLCSADNLGNRYGVFRQVSRIADPDLTLSGERSQDSNALCHGKELLCRQMWLVLSVWIWLIA
jgi:hypothetical protein